MQGMWNSYALMTNGIDEEEYKSFYARQNKLSRDPLSDFFALHGSLLVPFLSSDGHSGVASMDVSQAVNPLDSRSPLAQQVFDRFEHADKPDAPWWRALKSPLKAGVGILGAEPLTQLFETLFSGKDERGDPVESPTDIGALVWRRLTPDWFPGNKDFQQMGRAISGTNIDPNTTRPHRIPEVIANRFLSTYLLGTDAQKFSAALSLIDAGSGRNAAYVAQDAYDDLLRTRLLRMPNASPAEKEAVAAQHLSEHPVRLIGADDTNPIDRLKDPQERDLILRRAQQPGFEARFYARDLDNMIAAYAKYRSMARFPDKTFDARLKDLVNQKLVSGAGIKQNDVDPLNQLIKGYEDHPDTLAPDALSTIQGWAGRARLSTVKKLLK